MVRPEVIRKRKICGLVLFRIVKRLYNLIDIVEPFTELGTTSILLNVDGFPFAERVPSDAILKFDVGGQ